MPEITSRSQKQELEHSLSLSLSLFLSLSLSLSIYEGSVKWQLPSLVITDDICLWVNEGVKEKRMRMESVA